MDYVPVSKPNENIDMQSSMPYGTSSLLKKQVVKSIFPYIIFSIITTIVSTSLGVYLAMQSQIKKEENTVKQLHEELDRLKSIQLVAHVTTPEALLTSASQALVTETATNNAHIVTYQDYNIPALTFKYDENKWQMKKTDDSYYTRLTFENKQGVLTIKYGQNAGSGCGFKIIKPVKLENYWYRFEAKPFKSIDNIPNSYRYVSSLSKLNAFGINNVEKYGSNNLKVFLNTICNKDSEKYQGIAGGICKEVSSMNVDDSILVCDYGSYQNSNSIYIIEYIGTNPTEADEIVKQIKLE